MQIDAWGHRMDIEVAIGLNQIAKFWPGIFLREGDTMSAWLCDNTVSLVVCFVTRGHMVVRNFQYVTSGTSQSYIQQHVQSI